MKNLPARLRKHADEVLDPGYPYYGTPEMVRDAADEIARLRLTDEERDAFKLAAEWCLAYGGSVYDAGHAIDRFLERTK
jgi:hypothetical protein